MKELFSELKKFKVQTTLVSDYKKRNNRKIFHSSAEIFAGDSDIDEELKSMHQSIIKIKSCAYENWIVLDVIMKHSIKIFEC